MDFCCVISRTILAVNVFVYCKNNPVNRADPDGHSSVLTLGCMLGAAFISTVFGVSVANSPAVKQKAQG